FSFMCIILMPQCPRPFPYTTLFRSPELLVPRVGPYDIFAIRWGYAPIPEATTPEEELPVLDEWARAQDTVPWYRFATSDARGAEDRKSTRLNSSHVKISYAVFCLKK